MKVKYEKFEPKEAAAGVYAAMENGSSFGFHGVCHDFTAPEKVIPTMEFEGLPETRHVVMETTRFEELSSERCRVNVQIVFHSVADRDGMVQADMERGTTESYERLDELIPGNLIDEV